MAPPDGDVPSGAGGAGNSSDFVRKLYKMLEEPSYNHIVRWAEDGASFIVLNNDKFTTDVLPKHFKHSNFASFVRQLNKYDFHKVRHTEESGGSPYGQQAWEFKHPEFNKYSKGNLDNIRRKAPAPRKQQVEVDPFTVNQQVNIMSDSFRAVTEQVQGLNDQMAKLQQQNQIWQQMVANLQNNFKTVTQLNRELVQHLHNLDERRRNSRHSTHSAQSNFQSGNLGTLPDGNDEPSAELRRARDLLNLLEQDPTDQASHRVSNAYQQTNSPPDSAASSVMYSQQQGSNMIANQVMPNFLDDRHTVYPIGHDKGIDPFHSTTFNSLPVSLPPQIVQPDPLPVSIGKNDAGDLWGPRKPRVFLVEDDKTCSRVGSKFLSQIGVSVELANDGDEATNKVNADPERFDLIFMDIIMPACDGVSATMYIRQINQRVPIIAMTSNIRQDEIASYYQWGMNDILAKPFTKDGMAKILMKFCSHLLKAPAASELEPNGSAMLPMGNPIATPTTYAGAIPPAVTKFETTPINSPATSGSWHSPNQSLAQASPNLDGGYMQAAGVNVSNPQMVLAPGGMAGGVFTPQMPQMPQMVNASMPRMQVPSMMGGVGGAGAGDDRPLKRQRLYAPPGQPAPPTGAAYRQ